MGADARGQAPGWYIERAELVWGWTARIRAYLVLDVNGDDLLYKGGSLAGRVWLSTWERGAIICLGGLGYLLIVPYPARYSYAGGVQEMAIVVTKLNEMAKRNETSH